jgi:hypothetical protein
MSNRFKAFKEKDEDIYMYLWTLTSDKNIHFRSVKAKLKGFNPLS